MNRQNVALQIIAAFLIALSVVFFNSCGEDEEDEFINPKSTAIGPQGKNLSSNIL